MKNNPIKYKIPSDNSQDELHENISNDSILEVMVTVILLIIVIFIFVKFEFF